MKKCMLITFAAALAAAFVVLACASSGGGTAVSSEPVEKKPWRITREEGGIAARNNQVTLRKGENFLYIYFPVIDADFDKIQLDFTVDRPVDIKWQCVYIPGAVFGTNKDAIIGSMDKGPIETDCSDLVEAWFNITEFQSLEKSQINGVCLRVNDAEGRAVFTLTDVQFLGLVKVDEEGFEEET